MEVCDEEHSEGADVRATWRRRPRPWNERQDRLSRSRDGSTITFERRPLRGGICVIFSIRPSVTGLKLVTRRKADPLQRPAKNNRGNLYTINPNGSGLKQLTHYPGNVVVTGSFSPDGKWVTYAKSANVFVMRADGTGARQITHGVSASAPDWGPTR
jgi:hypothetical protein